MARTFQDDLAFLRKHVDVFVLSDHRGDAQVAVVPAYQGRVMTSTADGPTGTSYGWINRTLIASGKTQPHFNACGGEDRFWLGPEGGQFSIFFAKGASFDLEHWFTPAAIDTEPFEVVGQTKDSARFRRRMHLENYSGTKFDLEVNREIRVLSSSDACRHLGVQPGRGVTLVGFESVNTIQNTGATAWTKDRGLLSIWILGMLNAAPATTVVIPFQPGEESTRGPVVNDSYFGKVPADRLVVKDGVLLFAADAKCRSKIGLTPQRCRSVLGSYDAQNGALTIVQFTLPKSVTDYVNSMWETQQQPFAGDVVNSYNDGPPAPGKPQVGQFYELETSSPALALAPGKSGQHVHRTIHLQGDKAALDSIARAVLGVGLAEIQTAFKR